MIDDAIVSDNDVSTEIGTAGTQNVEQSHRKRKDLYLIQDRGWFERNGHIYITIIDTTQEIPEYHFVFNNHGKLDNIVSLTVKEPLLDGEEVLG